MEASEVPHPPPSSKDYIQASIVWGRVGARDYATIKDLKDSRMVILPLSQLNLPI